MGRTITITVHADSADCVVTEEEHEVKPLFVTNAQLLRRLIAIEDRGKRIERMLVDVRRLLTTPHVPDRITVQYSTPKKE